METEKMRSNSKLGMFIILGIMSVGLLPAFVYKAVYGQDDVPVQGVVTTGEVQQVEPEAAPAIEVEEPNNTDIVAANLVLPHMITGLTRDQFLRVCDRDGRGVSADDDKDIKCLLNAEAGESATARFKNNRVNMYIFSTENRDLVRDMKSFYRNQTEERGERFRTKCPVTIWKVGDTVITIGECPNGASFLMGAVASK